MTHWRELLTEMDDCCDLLARLKDAYDEKHDEATSLRARITVLEAEIAMLRGTLAQPQPDEPGTITHNAPPNAPR